MANALVSFVVAFGAIWAIIWIHEYGHYYAGREIVGIPADSIRVVEPYFPRYVALRSDDEWISPADLERYRAVYEEFDKDNEHVERFHAAGELIQAAVVVPTAVAIGLVVSMEIGAGILLLSLLSTAVYVLVDLFATLYTGTPSGDYSVLAESSLSAPLLLLLGFTSLHVMPLLVLTS